MPRFPRDNCRVKKDGYNRDNTSVRDRAYKNMYFEKAQEINKMIKNEVEKSSKFIFWDHNKRFSFDTTNKNSCKDKFISDGVHLNTKGQYHLYKSIRGAVINACKEIKLENGN